MMLSILQSPVVAVQFFFMTVIEDIFTWVNDGVQEFIDIFQLLFSNDGIISIFYNETDGMTFVGGLLLLLFSLGMVRFAFNWVKKLIAMRG